jgi:ParG
LSEEEEKTVRVSIYLSESKRAEFKSACALHRKSMNEVLAEFIDGYLRQNEPSSTVKTQDKGVA